MGGVPSPVGETLLLLKLELMQLGGRVHGGRRGIGEEQTDVVSLDDLKECTGVDVQDFYKRWIERKEEWVVKRC